MIQDKYHEYIETLSRYGHARRADGILADYTGAAKVCDPVLTDLILRQQNKEKLSIREHELYGSLLLSMVEIVLKNHKFRHKDADLKSEIESAMVEKLLTRVIDQFDSEKGKAYSYCFRLCYNSGIHVCEEDQKRTELDRMLMKGDFQVGHSGSDLLFHDDVDFVSCGRKVNTNYQPDMV